MFLVLAVAAAFTPPPYAAPPPLLSTVTIGGSCARDCRRGEIVIGAGEIVGRRPDGTLIVVTARHVVDGMTEPRVYLRDPDSPERAQVADLWRAPAGRRASVLARANDADLALVTFRPQPADLYAIAIFASGAWPGSGDVIGDPNGALWTTSHFRFLESRDDTYVVTCATCGPGDSGGGAFDEDGRLAGVLIRQRVDPHTIVDGEAAGTTQFQIVSLAKVRAFVAAAPPAPYAPVAHIAPAVARRAAPSDAWARFDAMRRDGSTP